MPAKLSKPAQRRIRELYAQGRKKQAIARELDISRDTVAKYCDGVDEEVSLFQAPAAYLSEEQVQSLAHLAGATRSVECPACGGLIIVLAGTVAMQCSCGGAWVRPGWSVGAPRQRRARSPRR